MIIRKSDGWLTAMVGNELVMMSVEQGSYIALNEVGSRIWTLIDAPQSLDEICGTLEREFEVEPAVWSGGSGSLCQHAGGIRRRASRS